MYFIYNQVSHCGTKKDETEAYTEALFLLANTVDGAEVWLWPCLIRALLDPVYVASVSNNYTGGWHNVIYVYLLYNRKLLFS